LIYFLNAGFQSQALVRSRAPVRRGLCTLDGGGGGFTFAFLKNKLMGAGKEIKKNTRFPPGTGGNAL